MGIVAEHRASKRLDVTWPVSVWIPSTNRFVIGILVNVSENGCGVFIRLPVTAPIRTGNKVELNFPRTERLAKEKGQYARIRRGKVVRVDRRNMFENAEIGIGIKFE